MLGRDVNEAIASGHAVPYIDGLIDRNGHGERHRTSQRRFKARSRSHGKPVGLTKLISLNADAVASFTTRNGADAIPGAIEAGVEQANGRSKAAGIQAATSSPRRSSCGAGPFSVSTPSRSTRFTARFLL
jgi:hypothetical protein